jgi:copper chaperone CopZ
MAVYEVFGSAVSCSRCLALLMAGTKAVDGVEDVTADKSSDKLVITYDENKTCEDDIKAGIRGAGFYKDRLYCIC